MKLYVKWTDGDGKDHYVPVDTPLRHQTVVKGEYEEGWNKCLDAYKRAVKRALEDSRKKNP